MGESKPLACVEEMRVGETSPHPDTVAIIVAGGVGDVAALVVEEEVGFELAQKLPLG